MPDRGFFELYPSARPPLPAGAYTMTADIDLVADPPDRDPGELPVPDAAFHVRIESPRYVMPPDQILSTFPPAGGRGDWRERLPQIVLKRRTLPWERNPNPAQAFETAPPYLALVVLAEGEGRLSGDVPVSECVTPGVALDADADAPAGRYLEVDRSVVHAAFPCLDELPLLAHVRKVDLSDTELALGDDDGYLAVVLANRLPTPRPTAEEGDESAPLTYTAYLLNLEGQLDALLPTAPPSLPHFDATRVDALVNVAIMRTAPDATVDELTMHLGAAADDRILRRDAARPASSGAASGREAAASAWSIGPVLGTSIVAADESEARMWKVGIGTAPIIEVVLRQRLRFPVLVSWDFTCTADGGFERLINELGVGLLGTLEHDEAPVASGEESAHPPEVAPTGHVALDHRTRRGEPARAWYRGPFVPQATTRTSTTDGTLPLAHTGDQLRKVVPDGREDLAQAAAFEIGRLLTLSKPGIVSAMMAWRRDLFGAARAQQLADAAAASALPGIGDSLIAHTLEDLVRGRLVRAISDAPPDLLAPRARDAALARVPEAIADLGAKEVLTGLGADPAAVRRATKVAGVEGIATVPVRVGETSGTPLSSDREAMSNLTRHLDERVQRLTTDALKLDDTAPRTAVTGRRRRDTLDAIVTDAERGEPS